MNTNNIIADNVANLDIPEHVCFNHDDHDYEEKNIPEPVEYAKGTVEQVGDYYSID